MMDISFLYVTSPNMDTSEKIALVLIEEKIIACANIFPQMKSIYAWEGKIEKSDENVLILKTSRKLIQKVRDRVLELHPYQVPCILELPINSGNHTYLQWIQNNVV